MGGPHEHSAVSHFTVKRSVASTSTLQNSDEENLLASWTGNAIVCATITPIVVAIGRSKGNKPTTTGSALVIVWVVLAILLQLMGMSRYYHSVVMDSRAMLFLLIMALAIGAYLFLAISTITAWK